LDIIEKQQQFITKSSERSEDGNPVSLL